MNEVTEYIFIIGTMDDFETIDELIEYFENDEEDCLNASRFDFDLPSQLGHDTALDVGRGMAFASDWCADHTVSTLILRQ